MMTRHEAVLNKSSLSRNLSRFASLLVPKVMPSKQGANLLRFQPKEDLVSAAASCHWTMLVGRGPFLRVKSGPPSSPSLLAWS